MTAGLMSYAEVETGGLGPVKQVGPPLPVGIELKHLHVGDPAHEDILEAEGSPLDGVTGSQAQGFRNRFALPFAEGSQQHFGPSERDVRTATHDPVGNAHRIRNVFIRCKRCLPRAAERDQKDRQKCQSVFCHAAVL